MFLILCEPQNNCEERTFTGKEPEAPRPGHQIMLYFYSFLSSRMMCALKSSFLVAVCRMNCRKKGTRSRETNLGSCCSCLVNLEW